MCIYLYVKWRGGTWEGKRGGGGKEEEVVGGREGGKEGRGGSVPFIGFFRRKHPIRSGQAEGPPPPPSPPPPLPPPSLLLFSTFINFPFFFFPIIFCVLISSIFFLSSFTIIIYPFIYSMAPRVACWTALIINQKLITFPSNWITRQSWFAGPIGGEACPSPAASIGRCDH